MEIKVVGIYSNGRTQEIIKHNEDKFEVRYGSDDKPLNSLFFMEYQHASNFLERGGVPHVGSKNVH